jgi:co-chaperonin GroES (HSP10)
VLVEGKVDPKERLPGRAGRTPRRADRRRRELKVKVGDMVSISPYTGTTAWAIRARRLQYLIIHVHTPQGAP